MAKLGRLNGNPHSQLTVRGRRQSRLFPVHRQKKGGDFFFRPLSWNYTAACCPLNAARRSLKPRDSSFGTMVFGILCRRADLHDAKAFPPRPIELSLGFSAKRVAFERVAGGSVVGQRRLSRGDSVFGVS
jgi:hypothetical protein